MLLCYPVVAVLDTSGKEPDLVMPVSTCMFIGGLALIGSLSPSENERELHTNKWIALHLQTCQTLKTSCSRQPCIAANWYVFSLKCENSNLLLDRYVGKMPHNILKAHL